MLTKDDYNRELKARQELLAEKLAEREHLDKEIAELRQDIGSLAQLAGRTKVPPGILTSMGLTDSCREVLRAVSEPLTVAEVRDGLERLGYDTASYANILASIQTTLKRMDDVAESDKDGKKAYKLKPVGLASLMGITPTPPRLPRVAPQVQSNSLPSSTDSFRRAPRVTTEKDKK